MRNGIKDLNTSKQSDLDKAQADLSSMIDTVNVRTEINGVYIGDPEGNVRRAPVVVRRRRRRVQLLAGGNRGQLREDRVLVPIEIGWARSTTT